MQGVVSSGALTEVYGMNVRMNVMNQMVFGDFIYLPWSTFWSDRSWFAHSRWCGNINTGTYSLPRVVQTRCLAHLLSLPLQKFSRKRFCALVLFTIALSSKIAQFSENSHLPIVFTPSRCPKVNFLIKVSVIIPIGVEEISKKYEKFRILVLKINVTRRSIYGYKTV